MSHYMLTRGFCYDFEVPSGRQKICPSFMTYSEIDKWVLQRRGDHSPGECGKSASHESVVVEGDHLVERHPGGRPAGGGRHGPVEEAQNLLPQLLVGRGRSLLLALLQELLSDMARGGKTLIHLPSTTRMGGRHQPSAALSWKSSSPHF